MKKINIENRTYYFFDDLINIKNLDPDKIQIDENSYKNILIYHIGCVTVKDPSYAKINRVNILYLINDKINGQIEESNENKYLTLVPTDESKGIQKKCGELWSKIRDDLTLRKTLNLRNMMIVVRSVFYEGSKHYAEVLLNEFSNKL